MIVDRFYHNLGDYQATILEDQSVIKNLLCEVALTNGINTDDDPKGEKRKREDTDRKRDQAKKKAKTNAREMLRMQ